MNYGNEDTRYFGGIPSSIISYSSDRGRYQAYDGIYDITTTTSQQLTTLQNQLSAAQKQIYELQNRKISLQFLKHPNLLVNGDCSQFTLLQPIFGTVNAGANNAGFQLQGRAVPIMDRWYHVAELAGANPQNVRFECSQVLLSGYINPITPLESRPSTCTYGMKCVWKNASGSTVNMMDWEQFKSPASRVSAKSGAMLALQHMVPDVKLTVNQSYTMGFWLYTNYTSKGMIRILRQYNTTGGGGNMNTESSLEHIYIKSFNFGSGWNYITADFKTTTLNANTISGLNGLVVQIGPFYYTWKDIGSWNTAHELYGDAPVGGQSSYEWILTEIQLRSDNTIAGKTNFIVNPKEYEDTLPYICSTSKTGVDVLDNMNSRVPAATITGSAPKNHSVTITFDAQIRLPVKMKEAPKVIIYNTVDTLLTKAIGGYFTTTDSYNQDSATGPMWNGMKLLGLVFNFNPKRIFENGATFAMNDMALAQGWPLNAQITFVTDTSFRFTFYTTYTFTHTVECQLMVDNPVLYFPGGVMTQFVYIVPETHMGRQDQYEFLSYVDFTLTALTSVPFPISI